MAEYERTRRNYPRRLTATSSDEEANLDKKLQELQMYEPGMSLDHKKKVIAFIEESMGATVLELEEELSSSPSLSSRTRPKMTVHTATGPDIIEEHELVVADELPDTYDSCLLEACKDKSTVETDEASQSQGSSEPSTSEVIEVTDDSDTSLEKGETKSKEEPVKHVTKKFFAGLEERGLLVQPFLTQIEPVEPSPLPPYSFDENEYQRTLDELMVHTQTRLKEVRSREARNALCSTKLEEIEERVGQPADQVIPPVTATEPEESSCPICGRSFPIEEIEDHASECFNYEGFDGSTTSNSAPATETDFIAVPSTSTGCPGNVDSGPDIEELDQNDRKRHNYSAGRRTRQREKRQKY